MAEHLHVEVVSADRLVWEGDAEQVTARTTEGDLGILADHEPMLGALVPCVVDIVATSGTRESIIVDGGFISVDANQVAVLSQFARLGAEVDVADAELELAHARRALEAGDTSPENMRHLQRAQAQLAAAEAAGRR